MFSVNTIVSLWDFATASETGSGYITVFGLDSVVGALFSGAGAVIIVLAILRKMMHLEYYLRPEHFNGMGIFLLLLSLTWAYFYFNDYLAPWYGQGPVEKVIQTLLSSGWAAPLWFLMIFSNVVLPWATLWSKKIRRSIGALFFVSVFVQVGMYLERYIIIPVSLGRNELPFSWGKYTPFLPEILITLGAFSLVGFLYVLFSRIIPIIPIWEVREGQLLHGWRQIGGELIQTSAEPED